MKILRTNKATLFSWQAFSDYFINFHRHRRKVWSLVGLWKLGIVSILVYFLTSSLLIRTSQNAEHLKGKISYFILI